MTRTFVPIDRSSMISGIGYDDETGDMDVHFSTTGGVYRYHDVPEDLFQDVINAGSVGQAFNEQIKTRYPWTRIQ